MMLAYFPSIYPDELLYSVLARYSQHVGSPGPMHTMNALFGNQKVIATFDLPGHLQSLADRIHPDRGLSVDRMIDSLTLFPYFTAFEPAVLQAQTRNAMHSGSIDSLHVRLGLSAFRIGRNQRLRFCSECVCAMQAARDELWWRRDHQLPGVLVCPEHACLLQDSTVSFSQFSRHEFVAATLQNCPPRALRSVPMVDHAGLAHLHRIGLRSADLLRNPPASRSLDRWTVFYRSHMLEAGLIKSVVTMDQHRLDQEFRHFYGRTLESLPSVMEGADFAGDWLASMVRKHRKANHPLYHVLVQDFLQHREPQAPTFGTGPWPCINTLAKHRVLFPITTFTQHRNHGNRVGVFACDCGYVYTRCLDSQTGILGPPRFLRYGPLLEPVLRELVTAGVGLRQVGRSLGLDPKTVVRLAGELSIAVSWKSASVDKPSPVPPYAAEPCESHTLGVSLPAPVNPCTPRRQRRDWSKIDADFAVNLSAWAEAVYAELPPVRITLAELERRIGQRGWLLSRRDRLPKSKEYLDRVVESTEAFQLRRIHWVIAELERSGAQVKAWQVMRKVGLRSTSLAMISGILAAAPSLSRMVA